MKFSSIACLLVLNTTAAFLPLAERVRSPTSPLRGYLDDLSKDLNAPDNNPNPEEESREATKLAQELVDRAGPGSWETFVDFDEFDGGDGQMGVAGDGNKKLEKFDMSQLAKSKTMSAKNAWGRSTGYAQELISRGMETQRAQQLENWMNQQEILQQRKQQRFMTDDFDKVTQDEDWRSLASFGVERNQVGLGGSVVRGTMHELLEAILAHNYSWRRNST